MAKTSNLKTFFSKNRKYFLYGSIAIFLFLFAVIGFWQIKGKSLFNAADLYAVVPQQSIIVIETKNTGEFFNALLPDNGFAKQINESQLFPAVGKFVESIQTLFASNKDLQSVADRHSLISCSLAADSISVHGFIAVKTTKKEAGKNPEITRFKGLGEISPDEFKNFIGQDIRLDPVTMKKEDLVKEMLEFYMGKNTPDRQGFVIDNLRVEEN